MLNDRIIDFLIENNFKLLVSLDGPKSIHDRYRIFPNDTGTFDIVMENLREIRLKAPDYYQNKVGFVVVAAPPMNYVQIDEFFSHSEMTEINKTINLSNVNSGSIFLEQFNQEELEDVSGIEKLWSKYAGGLLQHAFDDLFYSWGYDLVRSMFETRFLPIYRCFPEKSLKKGSAKEKRIKTQDCCLRNSQYSKTFQTGLANKLVMHNNSRHNYLDTRNPARP